MYYRWKSLSLVHDEILTLFLENGYKVMSKKIDVKLKVLNTY